MRLLGNFGTIRVGATAGMEIYWNRQWTISYKAASATLTKTVKVSDADLSAFYMKSRCEKGEVGLKLSQGKKEKTFDVSSGFNGMLDMSGFNAGLVKMELRIKAAKNLKIAIGWRT